MKDQTTQPPEQSQIADHKSQIVIVVPLVAGIGNTLMAEPMLRQMRDNLRGARIVALAINQPIAEVVRRIGGIDVVVTGGGMKNQLKGVAYARKLQPDFYLVPFPSNRWQYNALARAVGANRVVMHEYPIGKWSTLGFLHPDRVPAVRGIHDVEQNLRLLTTLRIEPICPDTPRFALTEADRGAIAGILEESKVEGEFVIMHAGSAQTVLAEAKRWPEASYAKLAEAIRDQTGLTVMIVEGPDEAGVSEKIVSHISDTTRIRRVQLRGSLGVAAALLERARFYVGTDSGLAHLAAAVGRRAITLFAPADPDRVCPFGNRDLVVQPDGLGELAFLYPWESTKPKLRPGRVDDIKRITVEQVMVKVRSLQEEIGHRDAETQRRT
jgi:ADP-heptose:LPS heptosyltransferase